MPTHNNIEKKIENWLYKIENETIADNLEDLIRQALQQTREETAREIVQELEAITPTVQPKYKTPEVFTVLDEVKNHIKSTYLTNKEE